MKHFYKEPIIQVRHVNPSLDICTMSEDGLDWGEVDDNTDMGDEADAFGV